MLSINLIPAIYTATQIAYFLSVKILSDDLKLSRLINSKYSILIFSLISFSLAFSNVILILSDVIFCLQKVNCLKIKEACFLFFSER